MRPRERAILSLSFSLFASSCASIEIQNAPVESGAETRVSYTNHTALFGLYPISRAGNLAALCPQGWISTRNYKNAWQSAVSILTLTLYSPSTVEAACKTPRQTT